MLHVYIGRAQDASQVVEVATAVCSFSDGKQITVQYNREFASSRRRTDNEVWMPGGSPMILFTQTALSVGGSHIPIGV